MTSASRMWPGRILLWTAALVGACCLASFAPAQEAKPSAPAPDHPSAQRIQPPAWAPEMPFTPVAHVEVFGSGPIPMVLIPGIAQDWTVFKTFMERNALRYTMYAVTLPGFGDSAPPPYPDNAIFKDLPVLHNALKAIQVVIADRGIDRPVIGGYELGAHLALWLALEHPDSFRAVIGIEGYPFVPLSPGALEFDEDARMEYIRSKIVHPMKDEPEEAWRQRMKKLAMSLVSNPKRGVEVGEMITTPTRGVTMEHTLEYYMSDLRLGLGKLQVPLLVIAALRPESWFRADIVRDQWRSLYATASCTTLVFFNKCKPYVLDEAPAELDEAVDQFLSGKPVSGGLVSSKGSCVPEGGVGGPER